MAVLAGRLKKLRKEVGMTQVELAEKLGVSKGAVAMWETGRRKPGYQNIGRLAEMYNKRVDFLLGFSEGDSAFNEIEGERVVGAREEGLDMLVLLLSDLLLNNESVRHALQSIAAAVNLGQTNEREVQSSGNQQVQCGRLL